MTEKMGTDPYLNARIAWRDRAAQLVAGRTMWMTAALVNGLVAALLAGAYIHLAEQTRRVPWLIKEDCRGELVTMGELPESTEVEPRHLKNALKHFVSSIRLVTADVAVQNQAIRTVYSMLSEGDPTLNQTTHYLSEEADPRELAQEVLVSTEVISVMHHVGDEWEVVWMETTRDRQGKPLGRPVRWRGLFSIYQDLDALGADPRVKDFNPLGLFIREYRWAKDEVTREEGP